MAELRWINEKWLDSQKKTLRGMVREIPLRAQDEKGNWYDLEETQPNPNYENLQQIIEAAEYHVAARKKIEEAAGKAGFIPNRFDGVCKVTGEKVPAGTGFAKKEGRWVTYSRPAVIELLGVKIVDLPKIPD